MSKVVEVPPRDSQPRVVLGRGSTDDLPGVEPEIGYEIDSAWLKEDGAAWLLESGGSWLLETTD